MNKKTFETAIEFAKKEKGRYLIITEMETNVFITVKAVYYSAENMLGGMALHFLKSRVKINITPMFSE